MKRSGLFACIMIPTLIALLLLPPLSCGIFQQTALHSAQQEAAQSLEALEQSILPLMEHYFEDGTRTGQGTVRAFLRRISTAVRGAKGNAQVFILASEQQVIYPYDEEERREVSTFAAQCLQYLPEDGQTKTAEITDESGERFLVRFYHVPTQSARISDIVTYCSVSPLYDWVNEAARRVLAISAVFVLGVALILHGAVRRVAKPLKRLSQGVEAIGSGSFIQLEPAFRVRELEDVRQATNEMSRRLQQAEQTQRDFLQNVSHELRNPLMSIGGYAQGIEHGVFSSPQEAAHTIVVESKRLTELVSSLLTLSRLENETAPHPLEEVRLTDPIQDTLDRISGTAMQRGVTLELAPFSKEIQVYGDEELICKVLENLLSNGIRYAASRVSISVSQETESVKIQVTDDGPGISAQDMPHIFERCYKGAGGHFGIGLAIAAASAAQMHGTLCVENAPEGGARFELQLRKPPQISVLARGL